LVECRDAGLADLTPRAVNLSIPTRPRVPLRSPGRGGLALFPGRRASPFGQFGRHCLSLTLDWRIELLRETSQEKVLRDDFADFGAHGLAERASLKKDGF
jgi:hypothetical protein